MLISPIYYVRFRIQAKFQATVFKLERLRCSVGLIPALAGMSNPNTNLFQKSSVEAPRCFPEPLCQVAVEGEQEQAEQEHDVHDAGRTERASKDGRDEEDFGLAQGAVGLQAMPLQSHVLEGA